VSDEPRVGRRQWLRTLGVGIAGVTAGCAGRDGANDRTAGATDDAPCADNFRITDEATQIGLGTVPRVDIRLENTGEGPIDYELTAIFQQGTSLGIDARTGRSTLSGTLGPGETVHRTATDDARDIRNTDSYVLSVSLSCGSA